MGNPQAFPQEVAASSYEECRGMTLRDYFAGQALVGFTPNWNGVDWCGTDIARRAYALADAMLKERLKDEQ